MMKLGMMQCGLAWLYGVYRANGHAGRPARAYRYMSVIYTIRRQLSTTLSTYHQLFITTHRSTM